MTRAPPFTYFPLDPVNGPVCISCVSEVPSHRAPRFFCHRLRACCTTSPSTYRHDVHGDKALASVRDVFSHNQYDNERDTSTQRSRIEPVNQGTCPTSRIHRRGAPLIVMGPLFFERRFLVLWPISSISPSQQGQRRTQDHFPQMVGAMNCEQEDGAMLQENTQYAVLIRMCENCLLCLECCFAKTPRTKKTCPRCDKTVLAFHSSRRGMRWKSVRSEQLFGFLLTFSLNLNMESRVLRRNDPLRRPKTRRHFVSEDTRHRQLLRSLAVRMGLAEQDCPCRLVLPRYYQQTRPDMANTIQGDTRGVYGGCFCKQYSPMTMEVSQSDTDRSSSTLSVNPWETGKGYPSGLLYNVAVDPLSPLGGPRSSRRCLRMKHVLPPPCPVRSEVVRLRLERLRHQLNVSNAVEGGSSCDSEFAMCVSEENLIAADIDSVRFFSLLTSRQRAEREIRRSMIGGQVPKHFGVLEDHDNTYRAEEQRTSRHHDTQHEPPKAPSVFYAGNPCRMEEETTENAPNQIGTRQNDRSLGETPYMNTRALLRALSKIDTLKQIWV